MFSGFFPNLDIGHTETFLFPSLSQYSPEKYNLYQSYVDWNKKIIQTSKGTKADLLQKCMLNPLNAYIGMLIFEAEEEPNYIIQLFQTALTLPLPEIAYAGLVLKYAQALVASKSFGNSTFTEFQNLAKQNPRIYSVPYLCLCARAGVPIDDKYPPLKSSRLSCLLYFYQGINELLKNQFIPAEDSFFKAYSIINFSKDIVPNLLYYLGLAIFLNGKSYDFFASFVSTRFKIENDIKNLWDADIQYSTPKIYRRWEQKILTQRAKLIIQDCGVLYPSIALEELKKKCAIGDKFNEVFESVAGNVGAKIEGDKVTFGLPHITSKIEESIKAIQSKKIAFEAMHN